MILERQLPSAAEGGKPILDWIRSEFNLPPSIAELCSQHFLRVWTGGYVSLNALNGHFPTFKYGPDGPVTEWIIHWQSLPTVVRSAKRVACSFREYNGRRYVVIKVWKGEQE